MYINSEYCLMFLSKPLYITADSSRSFHMDKSQLEKSRKMAENPETLGVQLQNKIKKIAKENNTVLINDQVSCKEIIKCPFKKVELYKRNILKSISAQIVSMYKSILPSIISKPHKIHIKWRIKQLFFAWHSLFRIIYYKPKLVLNHLSNPREDLKKKYYCVKAQLLRSNETVAVYPLKPFHRNPSPIQMKALK